MEWFHVICETILEQSLIDPLFDKSNAKSSLLAIAQARDSSIPMWRKLIIDCADILNNTEVNALGKDRFLRWNNETTQYPHKKDSKITTKLILFQVLQSLAITQNYFRFVSIMNLKERLLVL